MKKRISLLILLIILTMNMGCSNNSPLEGDFIDLTNVSSTVGYAYVEKIINSPLDYLDKTIKVSGLYHASYYDGTNNYYHYVMIPDFTGCCTSGIEFVWNGNHNYPSDYPREMSKITVQGKFFEYEELGIKYYAIMVDEIIKK